jgi:hypothetical protein
MTFNTLDTIITDLLNVIRAANISASEQISTRQIEEWIHQYRATLIKQDVDKGKIPNPDYIQEIGNLELEQVNAAGDDLLAGQPSNWFAYRTKLEIPKTIDFNFKSGLTFVGTPEGHEIQYVPESRVKWQPFKKYTPEDKLCFLHNGRLYIYSAKALRFVSLRGIFEVPTEVSRFVNPITKQPYAGYNTKYPIPANMVPILRQMILQNELRIEAQAPTDTTNNNKSDFKGQTYQQAKR